MDKKKIIYWTLFGFAALTLVAAIVTGLIGTIQGIDPLIHATIILAPIGIVVNMINIIVFNFKKDNDKTDDIK